MSDSPVPALPDHWLVVGLGNPGEEYSGTPHNLGFHVVDRLAGVHGIGVRQPDSKALVGKGRIGGKAVMLAKPQTFMNLSGGSVRRLFDKYEFRLSELVLVYDELALPWMNVRVRPNGSSAGHNGVESVIRSLGSSDFARVGSSRVDLQACKLEYSIVSPK